MQVHHIKRLLGHPLFLWISRDVKGLLDAVLMLLAEPKGLSFLGDGSYLVVVVSCVERIVVLLEGILLTFCFWRCFFLPGSQGFDAQGW
jgi:hypothetical protein